MRAADRTHTHTHRARAHAHAPQPRGRTGVSGAPAPARRRRCWAAPPLRCGRLRSRGDRRPPTGPRGGRRTEGGAVAPLRAPAPPPRRPSPPRAPPLSPTDERILDLRGRDILRALSRPEAFGIALQSGARRPPGERRRLRAELGAGATARGPWVGALLDRTAGQPGAPAPVPRPPPGEAAPSVPQPPANAAAPANATAAGPAGRAAAAGEGSGPPARSRAGGGAGCGRGWEESGPLSGTGGF